MHPRGIRLVTLLTAAACLCQAQTSWERLAASAKLWVYVKYFHPRAAAADVDWDKAFATAAPGVLNARTDEEFGAAMDTMLSALKDPGTLVSPV